MGDTITTNQMIANTIEIFSGRMKAFAALAETQLRHAHQNQSEEVKQLSEKRNASIEVFNNASTDERERAVAINDYWMQSQKLALLNSFPQQDMLAETMFISIFSSLDGFLRQLLHQLFTADPKLVDSDSEKQVDFDHVLNVPREKIIERFIDKEVESLIRKSYKKNFEALAKKFNLGTLKQFDSWPQFVECSQRRNLITHCGGAVTQQYIDNCKSEGVNLSGVSIGKKLDISHEYLFRSIDVVTEVGIKVGQVLLRTRGHEAIAIADSQLGQFLFELLRTVSYTHLTLPTKA